MPPPTSLRLTLAFALAVAAARADQPRFQPDRPLDMRHIRLELDVDLPAKHVESTATLEMTALRPVSLVSLDAVGFQTRDVSVSRANAPPSPARHTHDGNTLNVYFDTPLSAAESVTVTVRYSVDDPRSGLHFFAPSDENPEAPWQLWSQGQDIENRHWIPCFDHPGERQTSELIVTADSKFQVLSNGRLVETLPAPQPGRTVTHWVQDKPHVSYLITLVVGQFARIDDTWRGVPVSYWVPESRKDDARHVFAKTPAMLDFFSDKIGVKYPWDKYVQVCCFDYGGGMENTSATTLGENALFNQRSALDTSSDDLIAHELAHQWWGDYLTCREWAHLWLNEGFASYFEALWGEHDLGWDEFQYDLFGKAHAAIDGAREKPVVDRRYANPGEMFDSRSYPKGAWILHMIRCRLGDDLFWQALNRYCTRYALQCVETDHLRLVLEELTGQSWERFFYDWTQRPDSPAIDVSYQWDESARVLNVTVRQTQGMPKDPAKEQPAEPFHFPLTLEFSVDPDRPVSCLHDVTQRETTFSVPLPRNPAMIRVDPNQTVLLTVHEKKPRELWLAQLTGDPNPVGRLRAIDELARDPGDAARADLAQALPRERFWAVQQKLAEKLGELGGDAARDALLASLHADNPKTRRASVEALAHFKGDPAAIAAVRPLVNDGDPSYRVVHAAIRTYGSLGADDVLPTVLPALEHDSDRELIRSAVLDVLGDHGAADALDTLLAWSEKGRPRDCRRQAASSLARLAKRVELDPAANARVLDRLLELASGPDGRLRRTAVAALGDMGKRAAAASDRLAKIASDDASERVRNAAKSARDKIQKDLAPAPPDDLAQLRKDIDELRDENRKLRQEVETLKSGAKTAPIAAGLGRSADD